MTIVKHKPVFFNNLFDEFFGSLPSESEGLGFSPAVNIHENNDGFHLELKAPGINKEDFKLNVEKGLLTISFEKKEAAENSDYKTLRREFSTKSFKRSFTLSDNINLDGVQAKHVNGILSIFLPKKEELKVQPKQISIS